MAQKAHDQARRHVEVALRLLERPGDAVDHGRKCDPAIGMRLRIEENLDMPHIFPRHAREIGPGQLEEILFVQQDLRALIVDVQERLQVREGVGRTDIVDRPERQLEFVALGEREHQLRLERAFDVQVKFHLRQGLDKACVGRRVLGHGRMIHRNPADGSVRR